MLFTPIQALEAVIESAHATTPRSSWLKQICLFTGIQYSPSRLLCFFLWFASLFLRFFFSCPILCVCVSLPANSVCVLCSAQLKSRAILARSQQQYGESHFFFAAPVRHLRMIPHASQRRAHGTPPACTCIVSMFRLASQNRSLRSPDQLRSIEINLKSEGSRVGYTALSALRYWTTKQRVNVPRLRARWRFTAPPAMVGYLLVHLSPMDCCSGVRFTTMRAPGVCYLCPQNPLRKSVPFNIFQVVEHPFRTQDVRS